MTRIDLRIGSLVVHGASTFAVETFSAALRAELGRRVEAGAGRGPLAGRFPGAAAPPAGPGAGTEAASAARLASRLLP